MKTLSLFSLAALFYVVGGAFMKYSQGLTQLLPTLGLTVLFSSGALIQAWAMKGEELGSSYIIVLGLEAMLAVAFGTILFGEQIGARSLVGITLVVHGIMVWRASAQ